MNRKKRINQLRNKGKTYKEIGKIFNISRQRIWEIFKMNRLSYKEKCLKYPNFFKKLSNKNKIKYRKYKNKVIKYYSGNTMKCCNCGFDNINCLEIDHINNNGAEERKKIGSGIQFYRWLIKNNFPKGYQVLCKNCNWLKYLDFLNKS